MSKMKEVANILNVEIGEEFRATGIEDKDFRITESKFERLTICNEWIEAPADILYRLLKGEWEVVKKPWKPKFNEKYFICVCGDVCEESWHYSTIDLMSYATGNCFKTKDEAKEHNKEVIARLQKIYTDGTPLIGAKEQEN